MTLALMLDGAPAARPAERIALALASLINPLGSTGIWDHHHWTRRTVPVDRLRRVTKFEPGEFADALAEAMASGLVMLDDRPRGRFVGLARMAVGVLGLAGRHRRREIDAEALAGLPFSDLLAVLGSFAGSMPPATLLARTLGRDVADVWDDLTAAESAGLVELWPDHPVEPTVTLSPIVADRLRLSLSEDGTRWLFPREPDPTRAMESSRLLGAFITSDIDTASDDNSTGIIADLVDPDALQASDLSGFGEQVGAVIDRELSLARADAELHHRSRAKADRGQRLTPLERIALSFDPSGLADPEAFAAKLPRPQIILGLQRPWPVLVFVDGEDDPVAWTPDLGPCPECSGKRLNSVTLCLVCLRSGADHLLPVAPTTHEDSATTEMIAVVAEAAQSDWATVRQCLTVEPTSRFARWSRRPNGQNRTPKSEPRATVRPAEGMSGSAVLKGGLGDSPVAPMFWLAR